MELEDDQVANAKGRFSMQDLENKLFIGNVLKCCGTDSLAKKICDKIKSEPEIPEALKEVYRIGLYTKLKKAQRRIRNRMYTLRRNNKSVNVFFQKFKHIFTSENTQY